RIAAMAQVIAMSASSAVATSPAEPWAVLGAPMRMTVPARPRTRPMILSAERRSFFTMKWASTAVHIGAAAPNTATRPLGTNCSDQKMIAQLHPMFIKPTIIATAIVRLPRGKGWRKATATMVSAAATATALANAKTNGGTSLTPIFIAAQVDPDRATPQAVQTSSATHGLASNWFYLVGGRAQLSPVWAAYGIGVQAGSGTVTHNDAVYLIDKSGRERVLLHSEDLAADL